VTDTDEVVTYNGNKFDFPFILTRCAIQEPEIGWKPPALSKHIDLSEFIKIIASRYTSKDTAADKFGNLYVPRTIAGSFLARVYKFRRVTDEQHLMMLQHNAIDLITTARMYGVLKDYPDFDEWRMPVKL
jgi:uncharacterized protein YprB with RNaseH-like and TPR domain